MTEGKQAERLLGESPAFLEVLDQVSQVASLSKPVLIVGERGTGKEPIAARVHFLSQRWDQEFLKMNCAAISENLLETELFGHDAGAFTGASKIHKGRFERAHRGSLFLDELSNTSLLVQEKLLRVIEYGEYERVGGSKTMSTDVRLIAATNEDLPGLARQGKFREDLLDRLAFDVITLPPLRERQEDLMLLAEHFAVTMSSDLGREFFAGFTDAATHKLKSHHWPGNVRELKNVVERSVYRNQEATEPVELISLDPFNSPFRPLKGRDASVSEIGIPGIGTPAIRTPGTRDSGNAEPGIEDPGTRKTEALDTQSDTTRVKSRHIDTSFPIDFRQTIQEYETDLIKTALASSQFNQRKTAEALGVTYHQLRGYLKKYNLLETD